MSRALSAFAVVALAAPATVSAQPAAIAQIGQPAPNFTLADTAGRQVRLADFRGRIVVLEWNNPGCPFVQKHYRSSNMQRTQQAARAQNVVWLTINSGAPGKQGHMTTPQAAAFQRSAGLHASHYLLDAQGTVGRLYAARTTPHMYVINARGTLVYAGAIDDRPTADAADIAGARNYVTAALADLRANRPVATTSSRPYGCSVKYAA